MKSRNPLEKLNHSHISDDNESRHCTFSKVVSLLVMVGGPYLLICSYFYFLADENLDELMKD